MPSMIRSLLFSSLLVAPCFAATSADWRSRAIYQVITDRFATSDGSTPACDASQRTYCGGTWKGITSKLDYIQSMGFDAVWISPITQNIEGTTPIGEAYHGYWPTDINALNSNFGTAEDLKALSDELHKRKMYFMVDVVVNHLASTSSTNVDYTKFGSLADQEKFHPFCWIQDYNNQTEVEQCWLGDENLALIDIDTEDTQVQASMNSWITELVKDYSFDGVRIDTVKHIRTDFWPQFVAAAGVFTMGEVLSGDIAYMNNYTRVMDSVLDYTTYYPLTRAFSNSSGSFSELASSVQSAQSTFKSGEFMTGSFLENHDQPRFQSITKDKGLVRNAVSFSFIHDGIPIVYYGQEQDYAGANDPENREALWNVDYSNNNNPLVEHFATLNSVRKIAISSDSFFLTTPMEFLTQTDPKSMVIHKAPLTALFTNTGSAGTASWTVPDGTFGDSEALIDVVDCTALTATASGGLTTSASAGMPKVLIPASRLSKSGTVCPDIATGSGDASQTAGASPQMTLTSWAALAIGFVALLV